MTLQSMFATCPRGLESLLVDELAAIGAERPEAVGGGAKFAGDRAVCYRANLESRIATRILLRVAHRPYRSEQHVYEAAYDVPWRDWFDVQCSIRVDVNAIRSPLKSLDFATLRIKDAVCDRFRADVGARPDVDTRAPDVRIAGFLDETEFTLYIDTSGEPLYKRAYRGKVGEAPIRENLAAGIIALTGWNREEPFLDPMCGSGTFLVEAARMSLGIAPGAAREFGFERLSAFDAPLWQRLRDAAKARELPRGERPIYGSDLYGDTLKAARETLDGAGLAGVVQLKQANVLELPPPAAAGVMVANPPYGVRLGEDAELAAFYPQLGNALKSRYAGWRCFFFTADLRLAKLIGLKAARRTPLFNGALECRLFEYRMVAGTMRRPAASAEEKS
jgi:putative N6-adenine-specific DNA methylase